MIPESSEVALRLAVAALGGLAVGIEREWSVKRGKRTPHFAGTRTFLLLSLAGALGAELTRSGPVIAGVALLVASALLIVVAYAITSRRATDVGGTTEVAALIVLAGGSLAGMGRLVFASSLFALTALVLVEKSRLHGFVERIRSRELLAAVRFAVLALVVFPLLPAGPFGPAPGFRPQELWALVLAFSGLSFISYLMLRLAGPRRGYGLAGMLGGLISSTALTLTFAQHSRRQPNLGLGLGMGVVAASTVLPVRVVLLLSALNPSLSVATARYLMAPFVVGLIAMGLVMTRRDRGESETSLPGNPLRFGAAIYMAVTFQAVLYLIGWASQRFGSPGTMISSGLLGLTDVDALIYSMVKLGGVSTVLDIAAKALAVGVTSNTLFKLALAMAVGRGLFRSVAGLGLAALTIASLISLAIF